MIHISEYIIWRKASNSAHQQAHKEWLKATDSGFTVKLQQRISQKLIIYNNATVQAFLKTEEHYQLPLALRSIITAYTQPQPLKGT